MEPNTLIYALNELIVISISQNFTKLYSLYIDTIFIIIFDNKFQVLVARQPYLCKNIPYFLDIYGC